MSLPLKSMKALLSWTSSRVWSPILTVSLFYFLIFFASPSLILEITNSRGLTIAAVVSGALAFPFLLSKLHAIRIGVPYLIWASSLALGLATQSFSYDGNAKIAFLSSIAPWFLGAALVSFVVTPVLMKFRR